MNPDQNFCSIYILPVHFVALKAVFGSPPVATSFLLLKSTPVSEENGQIERPSPYLMGI
jgi:hypothetical protein